MSIDVMRWVWSHRHPQQTPVDRLVLLALADAANDEGGVAWTGPKALTVKADASLSAVYESLSRLERTGQIRSWKEGGRAFRQVLMSEDEAFQILETVQDSECPIPDSGIPPTPPYKDEPKEKSNPKRQARRSAIEAVYTAWKDGTGRNGTTKLTSERRTKINARLDDGYTVQELVTVVTRGWRADPWPGRVDQNDLVVLLRDGSQVEKFLDLAGKARRTPQQSERDRALAVTQAKLARSGRPPVPSGAHQ